MVGMKQQEAVTSPAIVAEKLPAILAVLHCLMPLVLVSMTIVTVVCFLSSSYREVCLAEPLWWLCKGWSARTLSCGIFSNEAICQLYSKRLDIMDSTISREVLVKDVAVGYGNIKHLPKNILIILSALKSNMVVTPQLVITINAPHVTVIKGNSLWTFHGRTSTIFIYPYNLYL